ncbi:hypothetical protein ACFSL6_27025 [Paenibacillus thailandensis]|uniref:Uncharacterized protein n=1 Tax=Paenibacillus thailandensis TaxID=393250 RepID=A0ABW5QYD6_9BACL
MSTAGVNDHLEASLKEREASYDAAVKLLYIPMTKTYHTALTPESHPYAHCIYSSAAYALDLLESGRQDRAERAIGIVRTLLPLQDAKEDSPTFGVWPYFWEEPLARMKEPDWNYADFVGKKLVLMLKRHGERMDGELKRELAAAIERACRAIVKRDVGPSYTNIAVMGAFVTLAGGETIGRETYVEYGRNRLQRLYDFTLRLGTFVEFNSPTYTPIAIEELDHICRESSDPEANRLAGELLFRAWRMAAEHYHPRTGEWAGPHSRAYAPMLNKDGAAARWFAGIREERIDARSPRCPDTLLPYFRSEEERYFRCPIFDEDETGYQSYATTYMNESFCLGSFSKEMMWHQRRNLIAYADNGGQPAYVQLRFLKDGKDFSSAVFTGAQQRGDIVFGLNMALDYGDWHPVLDPVNGIFHAADLRIRFEIGGYTDGIEIRTEDELGYDAAAIIGEQTVRVKQLAACSDLGMPRMAISRSGQKGTLGIDYVIYEGPSRAFNLHEWSCAAWAFWFAMSDSAERPQAGSLYRDGMLSAWLDRSGKRTEIAIPARPDRISRLYRDNRVSFADEEA